MRTNKRILTFAVGDWAPHLDVAGSGCCGFPERLQPDPLAYTWVAAMASEGEVGPGTVVKDESSSSGGKLLQNCPLKTTSTSKDRPSNGAEF